MPATFWFFRSVALIVFVSAQIDSDSSDPAMSATANIGFPPITIVRIP
jgi:hypothetical protein